MQVKKRDGTIVNFDISKITEAISGANQDVKGKEKEIGRASCRERV